ncbi:hypothetical protein F0L68_01920 [Solihabitans fulvus]|uniref:Uncharacterized protein n=1 Tax=Solihabitans fulvus TaxID=1892852 RepID=A0A5B2XUB6_9PSEU|nr:hypothetical protein [Solihabitans fulvus]KAA2266522.1 hypothetical protein F0L68_01920 [Solihabitans fulvus]
MSRNVAIGTVLATVLGSGYFAVGGLLAPGTLVPGGDTPAARTFAAYVAARSAILLGAALWLVLRRSWHDLRLLLVLNGSVQVLDAVIGVAKHQAPQAIGPVVFAAALFGAAALLGRGASPSRESAA